MVNKTILTLTLILLTTIINVAEAFTNKNKYIKLFLTNNYDDKETVHLIYTTLMTAEKISSNLNIQLIAQDEIKDDIYIFNITSEDDKNLTLKMFDEEGYDLTAHRCFEAKSGENLNALNVKTMSDGAYTFILSDDSGNQLKKKITISR